jgi:membrane protein involved in colicin uptake
MRSILGIVSLLLVLAIVGVLAKKQLSAVNDIKVPGATGNPIAVSPSGNVQQQSQQIQQQFKSAAEAAVQQPRPLPDEK